MHRSLIAVFAFVALLCLTCGISSTLFQCDSERMSSMTAAMPFKSALPGNRLRPGSVVKVIGKLIESPKRFTINMRNSVHDNNVFHFNPRFDTNELVLNSNFPSTIWGPEEKSSLPPLRPGQVFELEIVCLGDSFLVTVNGNYFCEFNHRVSLDQADQIYIYGDVILRQVIVTQRKNLRTMFNVNDPAIPFVSRLKRKLSIGSEIHVYGRIPDSGRFRVNLQQGRSFPNSSIAFHFNPRYNEVGWLSSSVVVMNTLLNSKWGAEERIDCGSLKPSENFALVIRVKPGGYQVIVNGQNFAIYKHRITPEIVDSIHISGNVTIYRLITF